MCNSVTYPYTMKHMLGYNQGGGGAPFIKNQKPCAFVTFFRTSLTYVYYRILAFITKVIEDLFIPQM